MIKSELIEKLAAENTHLTHAEVERVVNVVLGRMVEALGDGGRAPLSSSRRKPGPSGAATAAKH
jgi:integration host factor subunit beta